MIFIFYYYLKLLILNFNNFSTASETLRGESFNFNAFYKQHHYIDPIWLQRFIGFAEGDGALLKNKHDNIFFVITQNESKVLYHIPLPPLPLVKKKGSPPLPAPKGEGRGGVGEG